ncbi:MAG: DUF975 family protein [Dorea sp.]|nr:DUF975 family protein [Dorea sp.]
MWTRERLKTNGKIAFKRNYWPCVGAAFIVSLITALGGSGNAGSNTSEKVDYYSEGSSIIGHHYSFPLIGMLTGSIIVVLAILGILLAVFIGTVVEMGGKRFFILNKTGMPSVGTVFDGFCSGNYGNIVLTMFLRELYTLLWSFLLIIPGVVKYYEYLMVPYILAENPGMDRKEAFTISKRMMNGQKMDAFLLSLSFIGWDILSLITCGIVGVFYVTPYKEATFAELYAFNKATAYAEGYIR